VIVSFVKIGTGALGPKLIAVLTSHIYLSIWGEIWYKGPTDTTDERLWVLQKSAQGRVYCSKLHLCMYHETV